MFPELSSQSLASDARLNPRIKYSGENADEKGGDEYADKNDSDCELCSERM